MQNVQEFYILGLPIDTDIGKCDFIKIKDYPQYFYDLQVVSMSKEQIYQNYSKLNKNGYLNEFLLELKKVSLYDIVSNIKEIRQSYLNIFTKIFNSDDAIYLINNDNFSHYRNLIMYMNCIKEEKVNPNPEIQKAIERSKRVKSQDNEPLSFADIYSSILAFSGKDCDEINNMTIYQFYMTFYRICQIKNYDTSTLFATVSTEKINIESWNKHIDFYEEDKHAITRDEFNNKANSLFGKQL